MALGLLSLDDKKKLAAALGDEQSAPEEAGAAAYNPFGGMPSVAPSQALINDPLSALQTSNNRPDLSQYTGLGAGVRERKGTGVTPGGSVLPQAKEFQFNEKYAQLDQGNQRALASGQLKRATSMSDADIDYTNTVTSADKQKQDAIQRLQSSLASNGMASSGVNLTESGKIGESFQGYIGAMADALARKKRDIEQGYSDLVNNVSTQREQMFFEQGAEEEAARLKAAEDEARRKAAEDEEARRQQELKRLEDLIKAPPPPPVMPVYTPPSGGGVYGGGGGGGEEYYEEEFIPPPEPAPAPGPDPNMVYMPAFSQGMTVGAFQNWIRQNVDPWVSGRALQEVQKVLTQAGGRGVPRSDLAWLIQHYSDPSNVIAGSENKRVQTAAKRNVR